jgi:hypothetical protein
MVAVKKAAALLGVDKRDLRTKISAGQIQGECRVVGEKEKWFLYSSELDNLLDSMPGLVEAKERTNLEGLQKFFEPDALPELVVAEPIQIDGVVATVSASPVETAAAVEEMLQSLSIEFAYRLADEHQKVITLRDKMQQAELEVQRLAPMERALVLEVKQGCLKDVEIKNLQKDLDRLQLELSALKQPWWKRYFKPSV